MARRFFADADELASVLTTCDVEMVVREPSSRPSSLAIVNVGDIEIQAAHITPATTTVGTLRRDLVQVAFPLARHAGWTVQGEPFDLDNILVTGPGETHLVKADGARRLICVNIPLRHFVNRRSVLQPGKHDPLTLGGIYAPQPSLLKAAHQAISLVYRFATRFPQLACKEGVNKVVLGPLLDSLIRLIEPKAAASHATPASPRMLAELEEYIHAHEDQHLFLSDLCTVAHASERTIRNVFHRVYGTSPTRYLRLRRLSHAHRALRQGDPSEVNVTDVAMQYGFLDFGRFAALYRETFGEYPSQTLCRS